MSRHPLRPLARILAARQRGENPEAIERENLRRRREAQQDRERRRAQGRLLVLSVLFLAAFMTVGGRMALLARSEPQEPRAARTGSDIVNQRADIRDRDGRILATNLATHSLYARPQQMIAPRHAATELAKIFPDLDAGRLREDFTGSRKFLWLRRKLSPEQKQRVQEIGEPGLLFGPREMRLYPNGRLAAHVLGGASFGREGVHAAEVVGTAGIEKAMDETLRDPARDGAPLVLSLDLTVQAALRKVLAGGMRLMHAKGAAAVLMKADTGEIVSLASLPDFDPNDRPAPTETTDSGASPLFNRAVQGLYELGSTFKIFTVAQALDAGMLTPDTMVDTSGPLVWGKYRIHDFHDYGDELSVADVIVESSNIGAARIAQRIGGERQKAFLSRLGLLSPAPLELVEAAGTKPLLPPRWTELSTMTISYGHGVSTSPVNLAAAYASLVNGGRRVRPTLLAGNGGEGPRIVSEKTSQELRKMLREVVTDGTASFGDVAGYRVGGKTGSADKPAPDGGYAEDRVLSTFASVFPADDPGYVLVVTLDEPEVRALGETRRTAGWTAVPVAAEIIRRAAPLLGLRPAIAPAEPFGITLAAQ